MPTETQVVSLDTAIRTNGLTKPLKDGSVTPEGISFNHIEVVPHIAAFRRMVRGLEFDVSEVAPTTYVLSKYHKKAFTAIPIFISRGFHHHALVVRPDAGIKEPKDLEGKRVGIRAYSVTAWIWTFGMLQADYGVDPSKITFITDDEDHVQEFVPPPNAHKAPEGRSLAEMITTGELDAAFLGNAGIGRAGPPEGDWAARTAASAAGHSELVPLFPNAAELEAEWYRRTGILPIHGIIVIKDSVLAEHPQAGPAVYHAFKAAKDIYLKELAASGPSYKDDKQVLSVRKLIGEDPLQFGFERNRTSIKALADFAYDSKIVPVHFTPEDLFSPTTYDLD